MIWVLPIFAQSHCAEEFSRQVSCFVISSTNNPPKYDDVFRLTRHDEGYYPTLFEVRPIRFLSALLNAVPGLMTRQ